MKKGILLTAVVLLSAVSLVQAEEGKLGATYDITFVSRYIWRGQDRYAPNVTGIQQNLDIDFYGTGLGVNIFSSRANTAGFENLEELDITLYYCNTAFEGAATMDYTLGWVHYNYPDEPRGGNPAVPGSGDMQEFFATLSWPELCDFGIVPSYTAIVMWPATSGSNAAVNRGWYHVVGLGYDLNVPGMLPETAEQALNLSFELWYNDGAYGADNDWSHAVFGVSTDFEITENLSFTPGLYYQITMNNLVNTDKDETWVTLGMSYTF
ncbi:MAG: TorF family putative porin [Planctomycetota bacterium]|jgi:hypothetical protein